MLKLQKLTKAKLWKGTQGAISILLACLMMPFITLAGVLLEASRYKSAMRGVDQTIGNSAYSALSSYDSYILERFGLLSVKQSSDDVSEDLTNSVSSYLGQQYTTDMRSVDLNSTQVTGVYPLSDVEVLKQQIQNSSCVMAPIKGVMEGLDLDSLIKQIENSLDFLKILEQFTAGVSLLDKEVTLLESLEDAKDQMEQVAEDETAYDSAFTSWQTAVQDLIDHLNTDRPDPEEDEDGAKNWDNKASRLCNTAETARSTYQTKAATLYGSLDTLQTNINSALTANASFQTQMVSFASKSASAYIDAEVDENDCDEIKIFSENMITLEGSLESGAKALNSSFTTVTTGFSTEKLRKAVEDLLAIKNAVASYQTSAVSKNSSKPASRDYHYADLKGLTDPDAIDELLKNSQKEAEDSGWADLLLSMVEIFNALVKSETFADAELNVLLDLNYYEESMGGLPSYTSYNGSIFNPYEVLDEQRAMEYLKMIDPDYDEEDPFGLNANSLSSQLKTLIESIKNWLGDVEDLKEADWFLEKCKAALEVFNGMLTVCRNIVTLFTTVIKNIQQAQYERTLLFTYLAYTLPNRTNFETGTSLNGFSFAKISRPAAQTGSNVPVFGDILAATSGGDKNYSFRGAELEYIIWGNSYERNNQVLHFWLIYLLRLLLDLPFVLSNSEVLQMEEAVMAVPYVGPILAILLGVTIAFAEPMLDTYILVNGSDVTIIKDKIFLTPSGIPDLLTSMVSMKLTKATKKTITTKLSGAFDVDIDEPPATAAPSTDQKPLIDMSKWADELLKLDYTQHTLFLMLIFGSEETYLTRLADLIQCEMTMRNQQKASVSQQVSGEYTKFDINQAYTAVRVQVDGTMNQLLPVMTFSENGVSDFSRVLYRGY